MCCGTSLWGRAAGVAVRRVSVRAPCGAPRRRVATVAWDGVSANVRRDSWRDTYVQAGVDDLSVDDRGADVDGDRPDLRGNERRGRGGADPQRTAEYRAAEHRPETPPEGVHVVALPSGVSSASFMARNRIRRSSGSWGSRPDSSRTRRSRYITVLG